MLSGRKEYYQITAAKQFYSQFQRKMAGHTPPNIEESDY